MARIDHIVVGVRDLQTSAAVIWERYGLEAQPGGIHTGAGTANLLVPFGDDQFLELLAITDHQSPHPIVGWLSKLLTDGDRLIALAVEPDDLDATAARLGEPVIEQDRVATDGRRVHFRLTGTIGLLGREILPFFVETTTGREWRCGFRPARHRAGTTGVRWVEMGGDETRIREQIACAPLPIRVVSGRAGVTAVGLDVGGRELVLRF
jgi:hypothetical protein